MNSNPVSVGSSGCSRHDEAPVRTLLFVVDPLSMGGRRRDPHSSVDFGHPRRKDAVMV